GQGEISKIKEQIAEMKNSIDKKKILEFQEALKNDDFALALEKSQSIAGNVISLVEQASNMDSIIEGKKEALHTDALFKINKAKELSKGIENLNAIKAIEVAEDFFSKENYLDAIKNAELAIALLSALIPKTPTGLVPLAVFPLLGLVVLIVVIKLWDRKEKNKKIEFKKIERNAL
ncbi:MAG: hypothetical protein Q7K42_02745, partial [Candidatus Diapherotrites archaeon]|nr:hypothetical protein [Candidatus Diapherotrites archaeon]